ncbi:MAG: CapA family protein [Candidatus Zixiibacteriota bacterium]
MSTRPLIISAIGDIMLGDLPACSGFGVGSMIKKHGPEFPFALAKQGLADSDLVIGNLEVVLSRFDSKNDPFARTHLRAQPETVEGLKWAGVNAVALANNHIMQHGSGAVHETISILRQYNIAFTGIADKAAGIENLAVVEKRGMKIGLLAYNFRPLQYFVSPPIDARGEPDKICSDIETAKSKSDLVILSLHWGEEFINRPSAEQVKMGRRFIDAGAHIILGHHPHIVQGVEKYRGRVIAYSLGDFIFDLWEPRLRKSMILRITVENPDNIGLEILPLFINNRWQPELLAGQAAENLKFEIESLSKLIDADADANEWNAEVAIELRRHRRGVYKHYVSSIHRFGAKRLFSNIARAISGRVFPQKK